MSRMSEDRQISIGALSVQHFHQNGDSIASKEADADMDGLGIDFQQLMPSLTKATGSCSIS